MVARTLKITMLLAGLIILVVSCGKKEKNLISMEEYISQNNITLTKTTIDGIGVVIDVPGTSAKPNANSIIKVKYSGQLTNGSNFDSGTYENSLRSVIRGWTLGIPEFGKGGKGTLYIPYELGYGEAGSRSIPGGADLIFEVELLDFR